MPLQVYRISTSCVDRYVPTRYVLPGTYLTSCTEYLFRICTYRGNLVVYRSWKYVSYLSSIYVKPLPDEYTNLDTQQSAGGLVVRNT